MNALSIRTRHGVAVHVPASLTTLTSYVLLEQEDWFEDELAFVRRLLRAGEHAVDVGANFGLYTTALAEAVGNEGKVYAFEPAAQTMAYLRSTVYNKYSKQVELFQSAVSDQPGHAVLQIGSTPELNSLSALAQGSGEDEPVTIVTLDQCIGNNSAGKIAFIKIDAEGHELKVGMGAKNTILASDPLILFEIKHGQKLELGLLEFLESLGFSPFRLLPGLEVLVPFDRHEPVDPFLLNLFACSERRAADLAQRGRLATDIKVALNNDLRPEDIPEASGQPGSFSHHDQMIGGAYGDCLRHYVSAQSLEIPARSRVAHLLHAFHSATGACAERRSVERLTTLARTALDLGHRQMAIQTLASLIDAVGHAPLPPIEEPFLAPERRSLRSGDNVVEDLRLKLAIFEAFERTRSFSSVFVGPNSLPLLDHICQYDACSPEMHRRRQLVRMRAGLQAQPEAHPKLVVENEHNLNPWFWSGR